MKPGVVEFLTKPFREQDLLEAIQRGIERNRSARQQSAEMRIMDDLPLIAIVDDNRWMRRSLARLLKSAGFRAETFVSAEDYLAAGKLEGTGCIILDIVLPGMNGFELMRRLTADRNRLPIVFMSAHDEPEVRSEAAQVGAVAFLSKPFDDGSLLDAVFLALK
jgi:FixJ family two-component response regulator